MKGREGEREGEKHQCVVATCAPPTGDLSCNPGMCPDSNQWSCCLQAGTQSTEPHQQGLPSTSNLDSPQSYTLVLMNCPLEITFGPLYITWWKSKFATSWCCLLAKNSALAVLPSLSLNVLECIQHVFEHLFAFLLYLVK